MNDANRNLDSWKVGVDRTLLDLDRRIRALESERADVATTIPAPPVVSPEPPAETLDVHPPMEFSLPGDVPLSVAGGTEAPQRPSSQSAHFTGSTEYAIGAKWLPRVGSGLVVVALAFFVAWGYQKAWIGPGVVFALELLFCAAFVVAGQVLRSSRENFGDLVTGAGSCGLFLVFAGGHYQQVLYGGEVLVALFLLAAVAHLAYGLARGSQPFWWLGLTGGVIGALMPLNANAFMLTSVLLACVIPLAAAVAGWRRWALASAALHPIGCVSVMFVALAWKDTKAPDVRDVEVMTQGLVYVFALSSFASWRFASPSSLRRPWGLFAPTAAVLSAILAMILAGTRLEWAALTLMGFGAAMAGLGLVGDRSAGAARALLGVGVAIPLTLAPFGFVEDPRVTIGLLCGLALLSAAFSLERYARFASALAATQFVLALATYLLWVPIESPTWRDETWLLAALLGALIGAAWSMARAMQGAETPRLVALAIGAPLLARLATVTLGSPGVEVAPTDAIALTMVGFALTLAILTWRSGWRVGVAATWTAVVVALVCGSRLLLGRPLDLAFDLALIGGLVATVAALATIHAADEGARAQPSASSAFAWALGTMLLTRVAYLVAPEVSLLPKELASFAAGVLSLGLALWLRRRLTSGPLAGAWTSLVMSGLIVIPAYFDGVLSALAALVVVTLIGLGTMALTGALAKHTADPRGAWTLGWLLGWPLATFWVELARVATGFDVSPTAGVTLAWTLYGVGVLAAGFRWRAAELRYAAFAVLGAAVTKALLIDLVALDPAVRVGVLLLLGVAMLGGGYAYARLKSPGA